MISIINPNFISKKPFNSYLFEAKEQLQIQDLNKSLKEGEILGTNNKGLIMEFYGENSFFLENHEFKSSFISKLPYLKVKNFYNSKIRKTYEPWIVNKKQKTALIRQKEQNLNKNYQFKTFYSLNNSLNKNVLFLDKNLVKLFPKTKKFNLQKERKHFDSDCSIKKQWYFKHNSKKIKIKFLETNFKGQKNKPLIKYFGLKVKK